MDSAADDTTCDLLRTLCEAQQEELRRLSARLALAEAVVDLVKCAGVGQLSRGVELGPVSWMIKMVDAIADYYAAKCSLETQATGTERQASAGGGIPDPITIAPQGPACVPSPEPAPRFVTLATAKAWCEEMRVAYWEEHPGRMLRLPASLLAALEAEAKNTSMAGSRQGASPDGKAPGTAEPAERCARGAQDGGRSASPSTPHSKPPMMPGSACWADQPKPEPPAQVCVCDLPDLPIGSLICRTCGLPDAATPAIPAERECYCRSCGYVSPVDPATGVPCPKGCGLSWAYRQRKVERTYTRQEVDALLAGLRERCGTEAWLCVCDHPTMSYRKTMERIANIALWPATEPERKE